MSDRAWMKGNLRIAASALAAVERDAKDRYRIDEEACGYLMGPADDALSCDQAVALPNLANKLHALDPKTYFRTARMFFAFNEKKFDDAVRAGEASGRPVKVLYHSHLDAGAYFSPTDKAVMSLGEPPANEGDPPKMGTGPAWSLAYLVTSVVGRPSHGSDGGDASEASHVRHVRHGEPEETPAIAEHRLFIWDGEANDFIASSFEVVND